jgi:hypothetical protein
MARVCAPFFILPQKIYDAFIAQIGLSSDHP